jgi:hypothetical protein
VAVRCPAAQDATQFREPAAEDFFRSSERFVDWIQITPEIDNGELKR